VPESFGSSFSFDVPPPAGAMASCESASSDESGNLAASNRSSAGPGNWSWELFSPSGAHAGHIDAASIFPQGAGWQGVFVQRALPQFDFGYWQPDGTRQKDAGLGDDNVTARAFRSSTGGVVVVTSTCLSGAPDLDFVVWRFDTSGNQVSQGRIPGRCIGLLSAVGDGNGNTLVLRPGGNGIGFQTSDIVGRWLDSSGNVLTPFFVVVPGALTGNNAVLLHSVVGGGAVLAVDGVWSAFVDSGSTDVSAAPDWLASHAGYDFTIVRNQRAYALLPRTAGDSHVMDLYSTQGNRCGSVTFPVGGLTTGADGTVIGASGDAACTKTVWPGLLR
jgi:hypothetical protein